MGPPEGGGVWVSEWVDQWVDGSVNVYLETDERESIGECVNDKID